MINRNKFDNIIESLFNISSHYEISSFEESISTAECNIKDFDIKVLFIGHFSAGKSALLNRLIDKGEILTEDQSPQTAVAAELVWSENEQLEVFYNNKNIESLSVIQTPLDNNIDHFRYSINSPYMKELQDFTLVDTPGFDSGLEKHNKALSSYIGCGSAYALVISIEKGTVDTNVFRLINELFTYSNDLIIFLNKTDKHTPDDVERIIEQVKGTIRFEGITAKVIPISKYDNDAAEKIVSSIFTFDAQNSFDRQSKKLLLVQAQEMVTVLNNMREQLGSYDTFDYDEQIKNLKKDKEQIFRTFSTNKTNLNNEVSEIVQDIKSQIKSALTLEADNIIRLMSSRDSKAVEAVIIETIRPIIVQNMKASSIGSVDSLIGNFNSSFENSDNILNELTVNIASKTKALIESGAFEKIKNALNEQVENRRSRASENVKMTYQVVTGVLAAATSVLNPVLEILIILAPNVLDFVKSLFSGSAENKAKEKFISASIPQILNNLHTPLTTAIRDNQNSIAEYLETELNEKVRIIEDSINQIETTKNAEQENFNNEINKLDNDISMLKSIIKELEE